jgi:hypothetical protein
MKGLGLPFAMKFTNLAGVSQPDKVMMGVTPSVKEDKKEWKLTSNLTP